MKTIVHNLCVLFILAPMIGLTAKAASIAPGETKTNSITIGSQDMYSFSANGGDTVTILMARSSGSHYPQVELHAPDGTVTASEWGSPSATIEAQKVTQAGTYYILCRDWQGNSTGGYGVSLFKNPGPNVGDPEGGAIQPGETKTGTISVGDLDAFSFTANVNDTVTILMARSSGSHYPQVELHAPDGTVTASEWGSPSATIEAQKVTQAGTYYILCRDWQGNSTGGYGVSLICYGCPTGDAPAITGQPQSQTVNQGAVVNFSVTASGSQPLSYRWRFNGLNLSEGGRISGTSTTNLTISNVQSGDAGGYSVVVTNTYGAVTSAGATLTVRVPPSITTQPVSQTISVGDQVTFSVDANGTPPLYFQWQLNATSITGATGRTFTISSAQAAQAGHYTVVVSNAAGSLTSTAASLSFLDLQMYAGLTIIGPIGAAYRVDYATNLVADPTLWIVLTNITLSSSTNRFVDWDSAGVPKRFYRVIPQ